MPETEEWSTPSCTRMTQFQWVSLFNVRPSSAHRSKNTDLLGSHHQGPGHYTHGFSSPPHHLHYPFLPSCSCTRFKISIKVCAFSNQGFVFVFFVDYNICMESHMHNFQALFCVYTIFINEHTDALFIVIKHKTLELKEDVLYISHNCN